METPYVDQLAQIERASSDELAGIERAYREIQRRDGHAMWHAKSWRNVALVLIVVLLMHEPVIAYLAVRKSQVQAFVQPVQLTEEGRMGLVGDPVDLFAYEPQDGEWLNMLREWVQKYRWRMGDRVLTKDSWDWLKGHTCGTALKQLERDEKDLDPYQPKKRNSVKIKSGTKTQTPKSYQVVWREVTANEGMADAKPSDHTLTFTVGRVRPKTMEALVYNRLGQCVNGYSIDPPVAS